MKARITERDFARMFRLPKSDIPVLARSLIGTYDLAYDFAGTGRIWRNMSWIF